MNSASRKLSTKEWIIIGLLLAILGWLAYDHFFDTMIEDRLAKETKTQGELETEIAAAEAIIIEMRGHQAELERLEDANAKIIMPSYNAQNQEINFLSELLGGSDQFERSLADPTREGHQVRRAITIKFTTDEYDKVRNVINGLQYSNIRCLIEEIRFNVYKVKQDTDDIQKQELTEVYDVSIKATFYETMFDGQADAFLPAG